MSGWASRPPALIVIGGFPGTGKTTVSRRLASDLQLPCLAPDAIGGAVRGSLGEKAALVEPTRIAYDVLFFLCGDYLRCGLSVVVELTLGWDFHWRFLDGVRESQPHARLLPLLLRCPRETALRRIAERHRAAPDAFSPPDFYRTQQKVLDIWDFLQGLERPDLCEVDAGGAPEDTYARVRRRVAERLGL